MRSTLFTAVAAAIACGLLVGGETTAFAWTLDLVLVTPLGLSHQAAVIGGMIGIGIGVAASLWVARKVYRAELAMAAAAPAAPEA